jgi:hypothetical protein
VETVGLPTSIASEPQSKSITIQLHFKSKHGFPINININIKMKLISGSLSLLTLGTLASLSVSLYPESQLEEHHVAVSGNHTCKIAAPETKLQ